jgi:nicotinamide N-methyltransferase
MIIAADTLWNPDLHGIFINTLQRTLKKSPDARVHLVAGLHTGRYTIESFLESVKISGFEVMVVVERPVAGGTLGRKWDMSKAEFEEEKDRRGWVIWIELRWHSISLN